LDDEYNAKVADFGASALKPINKDDFILFIQGTLGYLDPESFVSHHLTDKSDVYSFGVVLLELLTRKKALYIDNLGEQKALSHTFIVMFHQKKLCDILDDDIIGDEVMVVLEKLAELAMHCLNPIGDERPTMKEVAERLQTLRRIKMQKVSTANPMRMHYPDGESSTSDETKYQSTDTANLALDVDFAR
jgi:serine/threonine protein kinase